MYGCILIKKNIICAFFKFILNLFTVFNDASICEFFKFVLILFIHFNETRTCGFFNFLKL